VTVPEPYCEVDASCDLADLLGLHRRTGPGGGGQGWYLRVRLDADTADCLNQLCMATDRSPSELVRRLIVTTAERITAEGDMP